MAVQSATAGGPATSDQLIKADVIKANTLPKEGNTLNGMYVSKYRQPYVSPTPGELPLVAIGGVKVMDYGAPCSSLNVPYLEWIKDCGFNSVQQELGRSHLAKQSLESCEEVGLRNIVRLTQWSSHKLECSPLVDPNQEAKEHLFNTGHTGQEKENGLTPDTTWKKHAEDIISSWDKILGIDKSNYYPGWKKEACGGYQYDDESILRCYPWFAKLKDRILHHDKWQSMSFVNLLPLHSEGVLEGLGLENSLGCVQRKYISVNEDGTFDLRQAKSYGEQNPGDAYKIYLEEFEKVFRPAVWCYDSYLLNRLPNKDNRNLPLTQYFDDLEAIRRKALETNRPFWGTVRCLFTTSSGNNKKWESLLDDVGKKIENEGKSQDEIDAENKRNAEEYARKVSPFPDDDATYINNVIGIESRTLLAYGAKGLMFWALMTQPEKRYFWGPLTYGLDEVYEEGETEIQPTALYPKLQTLLNDFKNFAHLFLASKVEEASHFEYTSLTPDWVEKGMGFVDKVALNKVGTKFCMAHHKGPSGEFVVIVNTDPCEACELDLTCGDGPVEVLTKNGVINTEPGTAGIHQLPSNQTGDCRITFTIQPGDWAILFRDKVRTN